MKKYETKMRCFIALNLPYSIVEEAKRVQEDIRKQDYVIGNYTKPENIHLTLKFLGEIEGDKVEAVKTALSKIQLKKFECFVDELGVFSAEFVRIIWLHLAGSGVLELQHDIDEALKELFPKENRFQSHITIARVHNVKNKEGLLESVERFKVNKAEGTAVSFSLMKSTLTDKGPVFEILENYTLL